MKTIAFAIDNSPISPVVAEVSLKISKISGAKVLGVHGYNATLHERAFRIMEPILPKEYQDESVLSKQREFHDRLIRDVMKKISLSYLEPFSDMFRSEGVEFEWVVREGKNFKAILEVAEERGVDLLVIGAYGFNRVREGYIGSVCSRVLRGFWGDVLVVKRETELSKVVVCLDGSGFSIEVLKRLVPFSPEIHLLYVYDTNLHRFIFDKLKRFMYHVHGFSFSSEEQERLHDEFIDRGLKRVGDMVLERGKEVLKRLEFKGRVFCETVEGFVYDGICKYARDVGADLIALGRFGRHHTEGSDIGSVAENVVRYSPVSVLVGGAKGTPEWKIGS